MRKRLGVPSGKDAARKLIDTYGWTNLVVLAGENGVTVYDSENTFHAPCKLEDLRQMIGLIDAAAVALAVSISSELDKAGSSDRSAQFRTAIHIITGDNEKLIEGVCSGEIALERSGNEGFGYDPVFIPTNETRTFSEMTGDEKNKISHRGIAIREMLDYLSSLHQ